MSRLISVLALLPAIVHAGGPEVRIALLPSCGLQPQAAYSDGLLHVVYFDGDPKSGDVFYLRSIDGGDSFDSVRQVNSQAGSAVATGTIRGAQLAVDGDGSTPRRLERLDSGRTQGARGPLNPEMPADSPYNGTPLLYSRLGDDGRFEPQRNLMQETWGLDGGASIAADDDGGVFVAWHGKADGAKKGEKGRRVWMASSSDGGRTFGAEREIFGKKTGACACCGMKLFAGSDGVAGLFRSARKVKHRDTYLFFAEDPRLKFSGSKLDEWEIAACPMSSMSLVETSSGLLAGWETAGQGLIRRSRRRGEADARARSRGRPGRKSQAPALGSEQPRRNGACLDGGRRLGEARRDLLASLRRRGVALRMILQGWDESLPGASAPSSRIPMIRSRSFIDDPFVPLKRHRLRSYTKGPDGRVEEGSALAPFAAVGSARSSSCSPRSSTSGRPVRPTPSAENSRPAEKPTPTSSSAATGRRRRTTPHAPSFRIREAARRRLCFGSDSARLMNSRQSRWSAANMTARPA